MCRRSAFVVAALAGLLTACGEAPLAERDPAGYEACQLLVSGRDPDVNSLENLGAALFGIGNAAKDSTTQAIRDTAEPLFSEDDREAASDAGAEFPDTWDVDFDALEAACEDEGVTIPATGEG